MWRHSFWCFKKSYHFWVWNILLEKLTKDKKANLSHPTWCQKFNEHNRPLIIVSTVVIVMLRKKISFENRLWMKSGNFLVVSIAGFLWDHLEKENFAVITQFTKTIILDAPLCSSRDIKWQFNPLFHAIFSRGGWMV